MDLSQIEKNMLLLLDVEGKKQKVKCKFFLNSEWAGWDSRDRRKDVCIYIFERSQIITFLISSFILFWKKPDRKISKIYYVQHGLMSVLFHSHFLRGYHLFARNHLSSQKKFSAQAKAFLPVILWAEKRFIVLEKSDGDKEQAKHDILSQLDFLFFSNPTGKLLLTDKKTIFKGIGIIAKTTLNPTYMKTMQKEAGTVLAITKSVAMKGRVPTILRQINLENRYIIIEEYIEGRSLREILRDPIVYKNVKLMENYFEQLEDWFQAYRSIFIGQPRAIIDLYEPLFKICKKIFHDNSVVSSLIIHLQKRLTDVSKRHNGLVPITAHNDLWPGNFLLTDTGLVAIDWERATNNRCEIFDYFWMIISTALEYKNGVSHKENYSEAFRFFLNTDDPICAYALSKLNNYLSRLYFDIKLMPLFISLFLLEWSVQGYIALGRKTAMDEIALEELINYQNSLPSKTGQN